LSFILGKIFWLVAAPGNFLALLLVAGVVRLALSRGRRGFAWIATATFGLAAIAVLPIGEWLVLPLENRFPLPAPLANHVDGIIVLGGAVEDIIGEARATVALNEAAARLTDAELLARRYPSARILVSGGDRYLMATGFPEAGIMQRFLTERGIDAGRIIAESRSRTTYENAVFGREEAKPKPGETWLLVTSALHMPRAVGCFRQAGWMVLPYPVDYRTTGEFSAAPVFSLAHELTLVTAAMREWLGLAAYRLLGHTDALLPAAVP